MVYLQYCPYYLFNPELQSWSQCEWYKNPPITATVPRNIKIATFNVLFELNDYDEAVFRSDKRFPYQLQQLLPSLQADIYVLEEVTALYLDSLMAQPWVQKEFHYCSTSTQIPYEKNTYRCVIISRIPFAELYEIGVGIGNDYKSYPIAVMKDPEITVCAIHLRARDKCDYIRKEQLSDLFQTFGTTERVNGCFTLPEEKRTNTRAKKALRDERGKIITYKKSELNTWKEFQNVIMLGDFNMYGEYEEDYIPSHAVDIWKTLRSNEKGYTLCFNPVNNHAMNNHIATPVSKENMFTMRLDRILLPPRVGSLNALVPVSIEIFGANPISLENDDNILFPSDHLGLVAEIEYRT
jgi:endonuclease/exonuclease/phosphatase family metal-dependent hydrolase